MRPGQKPPRAGVKVNGITLGPDSPLAQRRQPAEACVRCGQPRLSGVHAVTGRDGGHEFSPPPRPVQREFPVQAGLIELLVGKIGKGPREPGRGLTGRIPSLILIHALPNGASASSATAAAKRKAEGQLAGMPDLCWPVARGPYHSLYLETKRPGGRARKDQRAIHDLLRAEGHAVVVYDSVQQGLNIVLAYHALRQPTAGAEIAAWRAWQSIAPDAGGGYEF